MARWSRNYQRHQTELTTIRRVLESYSDLRSAIIGTRQLEHDRELDGVIDVRLQAVEVVVLDLGADDRC